MHASDAVTPSRTHLELKVTQPKSEPSFVFTAKKVGLAVLALFDFILDTFIKQPASDLLGLITLRQGTTLSRFASIQLTGVSTEFGGTGICSGLEIQAHWTNDELMLEKVEHFKKNAHGYSFFLTDSSYVGLNQAGYTVDTFAREDVAGLKDLKMGVVTDRPISFWQKIQNQLFIRAIPRYYVWLASLAEAAPPEQKGALANIKRIANGILNILFTPTLKARINNNTINFMDDPLMTGLAVRTKEQISPSHFGFEALFKQGCNGHIAERVSQHPIKALWGLVRIINPLGLSFLAILSGYLLYQKASAALNAHRSYSLISSKN